MLKINRKIEYALIALKYMHSKKPGELTTVKDLCDAFKMPFDPLSRVLQQLASSEILRSEKGIHGGYLILKDLKKVSLLDVIQMLLGSIEFAKCFHDDEAENNPCELTSQCNIISPLLYLNEKLIDFFKNLTVDEVLNFQAHRQERKIKEMFRDQQYLS